MPKLKHKPPSYSLHKASGQAVVKIDGRSFLGQLRGSSDDSRGWTFLGKAVRDQRWKLYQDGQFFDVQADPMEKQPIRPGDESPEGRAARARLHAVLDSTK